ncbi:MAG: Hint domain-containing protein [Pseudomonadota bacterium]
MANYTIFVLAESNLTISGGTILDGVTQGDGSHLVGETIRLNNNAWEAVNITDGGSDTNFADNDGDQTLDGTQTVLGSTFTSGTRVEAEYQFVVEDGDGNTYTLIGFNISNSSPAYATVEGIAFIGTFPPVGVDLEVVSASEGPSNNGGAATPSGTYAAPPCFLAGTLLDTPRGQIPVEHIQPGDFVNTLDHGPQPLRLCLATKISAAQLRAMPTHRPVRISEGALGPGLPSRDILVSPQHRILIEDWRAELMFGSREVFAAAIHLLDRAGVSVEAANRGAVYYHLVFDSHQIVSAHGLFSESFLPGQQTMSGLSAIQRASLIDAFPRLSDDAKGYGDCARLTLKHYEARALAA